MLSQQFLSTFHGAAIFGAGGFGGMPNLPLFGNPNPVMPLPNPNSKRLGKKPARNNPINPGGANLGVTIKKIEKIFNCVIYEKF